MITKFKLYEGFTDMNFWSDVTNGELDSVKEFIENGGDVNLEIDESNTILSLAAKYGQKEIVKYLIDNGVDVNKLDFQNRNTLNRICFKDIQQDNELVKILVDAGSDLNNVDSNNNTPLMHITKALGSIEHGSLQVPMESTWKSFLILLISDWFIPDISGRYFFEFLNPKQLEELDKLKNIYPEKYKKYKLIQRKTEFNV